MTDPRLVPIAGPVFTEWYWTPIFFAIVYGPPMAEAADARAVTFTAFAAPGFHQTRADVFPDYGARINLRYERGGGELLVTQLAAEDDDLTPPDCFVHDGTAYHSWEGRCRSARTPR